MEPPSSRDRLRGEGESEGDDDHGRDGGHERRRPACGDARRQQPPRMDHGHAERDERAGEAEAEGNDEEHPERHLVLRDGGEQHDERGRAGEKAGGGAHAEEAARPTSGWW